MLNGGNTLGYRALNQVLKKTNAEYAVAAPEAAAYESDLSALQKLAYGHIMYAPLDFLHEASEVFGGEPHLRVRDDGSTYDVGFKWDTTGLLTASTGYKQDVAAIDDMAARWSSTVLPNLKHITAYEDKTDPETGETVTAARQMAEDIKATANAPEIEESGQPAVEMARQRAQEWVENEAGAIEGMKGFTL